MSMRGFTAADLTVEIADPAGVSDDERAAILDNCERAGLSFYRVADGVAEVERETAARFWRSLGLRTADRTPGSEADGLCRIAVVEGARYIPYTSEALAWHTDGYYSARPVRSFAMHCVHAAARNGANGYLNPEDVYGLLEEESPAHIKALSRPDAMTIPANLDDDGRELRPETTVPVFSFDGGGHLHTRWTERARNIRWRDDETAAACEAFRRVLRDAAEHRLDKRLAAGEGVVCNNVLHCREAFDDDAAAPRVLYRGRYYERLGASS